MSDFIINNGVLTKYRGPGGDVVIPEGVTEIGWGAFDHCSGLESVTIPDGVTSIGSSAFFCCESLESAMIPDGVMRIGTLAFHGCKKLTCVTFPVGLTEIGDNAFSGCKSLTNVTIPDSVTSIGSSAFSDCSALTNVTIPDGVARIGDQVFYGCTSLTSVMLPKGLTEIGDRAFFWCENLAVLTIPDSVTSIGGGAFKGCRRLQDEQGFVIIRGVLYDCAKENVVNVTIPDGVTSISDEAFYDYKRLTSVTFPAGMTAIGDGAFGDCKRLTSVTLPEGVTSVGSEAFSGCKRLASVTLPEGMKSIGDCAFWGCSSLTSVTLPDSVTVIDSDAFGECTEIRCSPSVFAHHVLFEPEWLKDKRIAGDCIDAGVKTAADMLRDKTAGAKQGNAAVKFALGHQPDISAQSLQALAAALKEKKCTAALKKLQADPGAAAKLDGAQSAPNNPVEELVQKNWVFDDDVKKLQPLIKMGVHYAGSDELSSPGAVIFVIAAYARQVPDYKPLGKYYGRIPNIQADELADKVAAGLEQRELLALLEQVVYEKDEPRGIAALARYGGERQVEELTAAAKQWLSGRTKVMDGALMLNDTRAAMMYMDKIGRLEKYAELRGTDANALRDTMLADLGFDEDGKKVYDLGNKTVIATVGQDLKIVLFDETAGKVVKSLPKKGSDTEKYAAASADLSELKKDVKKVAKARIDRLFGDFLSGRTYEADEWKRAYLGNPVLCRVAELLAWTQGGDTFILAPYGLFKCDGTAYTITDEPIGVAHPMQMRAKELATWQRYFAPSRLKQPFEQVWEPVIDPASILPERYEGLQVSVFRFMHREKHGIRFYDADFHNNIGFSLDGCSLEYERTNWHRHEIAPDETFTLGKFSFEKYTRQVNHIVALLDRWTVSGRILKDDVSVQEHLDRFTAAQIMEYIRLASENACPNCAAMLLEYKQAHYPDFDPLAEFTLE